MTADLRVPQAREFLAGARRRKVTELPPSILMRELAEARRQLGQVLDVVRESVSLTDEQLEVLGQALADAFVWRTPAVACADCDEYEWLDGLCPDHAADVTLCDAYLALARELGIEAQASSDGAGVSIPLDVVAEPDGDDR